MEPMPPATCSSSQNIRTRHSPAATRYGGGETREEAGNQCQGQDAPPPALSKEGLQRQQGPAIAPPPPKRGIRFELGTTALYLPCPRPSWDHSPLAWSPSAVGAAPAPP